MEKFEPIGPEISKSLTERAVGSFIAGILFVGKQLTTADFNPHEGRLRGSVIPEEYIKIPDTPPYHDDTI